MMKFNEYYDNHIVVSSIPTVSDMYNQNKFGKIDVIINVCDDLNLLVQQYSKTYNIDYFWFPMNEHSIIGDIGVNSIYGALCILWDCYQNKKRVLLHCHAGANRSPTVKEAFHYMVSGRHKNRFLSEEHILTVANMFTYDSEEEKIEWIENQKIGGNNILIDNCRFGNLPPLPRMEHFLKEMGKKLRNKEELSIDVLKYGIM